MGCNAPQEGLIVANPREVCNPASTACYCLHRACENFRMQQLRQWPLADRQRIKGVFTDIDDTLTTDGAITPDALAALYELKAAGIKVIAITGRPAGWSKPFARDWPVDAIVAENGSVLLKFDLKKVPEANEYGRDQLSKRYQQDEPTRTANYTRMQQIATRVLREVPGAQLAQDSAGRETDMAIDHSEFTHLAPEHIAGAVRIMLSEGMNATVSSIHINGWFGDHNKLHGARWAVRLIGLLSTIVLARLLSPTDFGIVAMAGFLIVMDGL